MKFHFIVIVILQRVRGLRYSIKTYFLPYKRKEKTYS